MNFKMQDKQNQLIERISDTHLIVGVDIAQQFHVARAVNFRGIVVGDPLTFVNNEEGFVKLQNWIKKLKRLKNLDSTIVGMEPTGHYWKNLSNWLVKQKIEVVTHLAEASSGKWKGQIVLSKRGRSRLRRFLYLATMSLVMNNPEFKAIQAYNVKVKKIKKMKSIMKLVGKLARIFVGIAKRNESYCANKLQETIPLAA
jgi:transposase